jgi:hypothetical protein
MKNNRPLLGLCPIGKFVFSNEDAIRQKRAIQGKLQAWGAPYVDLEGVLEDGLVKDQGHVDRAVEHFRRAGVDGLFMPHCNFGTEGAVGMIAKKLDVPVLLWGPRDEAPEPDGRRLRDSLCGLFASSKVLYKLGAHHVYRELPVDDPPCSKASTPFCAVSVADALRRGFRVGLIGSRIDFFWSTIVNESELLQKFNVEVQPFDMVEFIEASRDRARRDRSAYEREVRGLRDAWIVEDMSDDAFVNVLAVRDQMLALAIIMGSRAWRSRRSTRSSTRWARTACTRRARRPRSWALRWKATSTARSAACSCAAPTISARPSILLSSRHATRRMTTRCLSGTRAHPSPCVTLMSRCVLAITGSCLALFPGCCTSG